MTSWVALASKTMMIGGCDGCDGTLMIGIGIGIDNLMKMRVVAVVVVNDALVVVAVAVDVAVTKEEMPFGLVV